MKHLKSGVFTLIALVLNGLMMYGLISSLYSVLSELTPDNRIIIAAIALILWKSHYIFFYVCKIISHILVGTIYKPNIKNIEELRKLLANGKPFILAPGHKTFVDAFFIFYVMSWRPRPLRFAVYYTYYFGLWAPMWLTGCIPMCGRNVSPLLLKYANWNIMRILSKKSSNCVLCVFPEGALNEQKKQLGLIKKGVQNWVEEAKDKKQVDVPVLPLILDIDGSWFSRARSEKVEIPKPVDLTFCPAIMEDCTTIQIAESMALHSGDAIHPDQYPYCGIPTP